MQLDLNLFSHYEFMGFRGFSPEPFFNILETKSPQFTLMYVK